jgi:uncharacterized protein YbbK (DUF523 family)
VAKILISACLLGCKVRYNSSDLTVDDANFEKLICIHEVISFCPEVSAGMPIPRAPAEITGGDGFDVLSGKAIVIDTGGQNINEAFITAAKNTLKTCQNEEVQFAILAESSPSCGSSQIYDGSFNDTKRTGKGVTAALLEQNGISVFNQYQADKLLQLLNVDTLLPSHHQREA